MQDITYVLSFDVANRSLGESLCRYKTPNIRHISELYDSMPPTNVIRETIDALESTMEILHATVTDLLGKSVKSVAPVDRARALRNRLEEIDDMLNREVMAARAVTAASPEIIVLVEYQMNINDKRRCVANQLLYHFCRYKIFLINPSIKNAFSAGPDYADSIARHATNYAGNKAHARANLLCVLRDLGREELLKPLKKSNYDDLADSIIMSICWVMNNKYFLRRGWRLN